MSKVMTNVEEKQKRKPGRPRKETKKVEEEVKHLTPETPEVKPVDTEAVERLLGKATTKVVEQAAIEEINRLVYDTIEEAKFDFTGDPIGETVRLLEVKAATMDKARKLHVGDDSAAEKYAAMVAEKFDEYLKDGAHVNHYPGEKLLGHACKEEEEVIIPQKYETTDGPRPIVSRPLGRRIPGMRYAVQSQPLSRYGQHNNAPKPEYPYTPEEAIPSGEAVEQLIKAIYGERSKKYQPKDTPKAKEEKKEEQPALGNLHIGLARRLALSTEGAYNSPLYVITRRLLDEQYPNKEYLRPYKYGLVAPCGSREECFETEKELQDLACGIWPFNSLLRYRSNWLVNYFGYDTYWESDLKFSIHRVRTDKDKFDYVVIEDSHSTRPLSFPTKDMADNFLIVFRDLIEASNDLI